MADVVLDVTDRRFVRSVPPAARQLVLPQVESLALEHVSFRYGDVPVLRDLCIEAPWRSRRAGRRERRGEGDRDEPDQGEAARRHWDLWGQWQRLALARIRLRGAGVWILDEPTSAIDAEAEREIFAELRRTKEERVTIVVSHRAWTLREMDRIYVIDGGAVVQEGTYPELMARQTGRFARLFAA
ncbi:hypothetical protein [Kribbella pratensis]|nr:hypothetical protein [Kribbella pratensis]